MRAAFALLLIAPLAACASAPAPNSGFLTRYDQMPARTDTVRASIRERQDAQALAQVRKVAVAPTVYATGATVDWMTEAERKALAREVDAQLCFELSKRYELAPQGAAEAHKVRAAIAGVEPTGRFASAASAAASFFIPGPLGVRAPGTTGALAVEAEMLAPAGEQIAAISWRRTAKPVGTDDPSLSRIGDALQFAEPFADAAARTMTAKDHKSRKIGEPDPCAEFGARLRPEGFLAKFATGLYVPDLSGAKKD
ncbi:MAG TPA: DUF3313 domain-containing protein [Phenylobacterium sp.]|nr:DUF3313 domain-containing protein [Phenylobacterium sp.]